jgi:hypothetical protein
MVHRREVLCLTFGMLSFLRSAESSDNTLIYSLFQLDRVQDWTASPVSRNACEIMSEELCEVTSWCKSQVGHELRIRSHAISPIK